MTSLSSPLSHSALLLSSSPLPVLPSVSHCLLPLPSSSSRALPSPPRNRATVSAAVPPTPTSAPSRASPFPLSSPSPVRSSAGTAHAPTVSPSPPPSPCTVLTTNSAACSRRPDSLSVSRLPSSPSSAVHLPCLSFPLPLLAPLTLLLLCPSLPLASRFRFPFPFSLLHAVRFRFLVP